MILDQLVLHDFGAYGGRQAIELTPVSPDRPITLFGGMNGGGKTTMLDAIQLCLYGVMANTSNRTGSYQTYLDRSIHRAAGTNDAAVELAFSRNVAGSTHNFRLHRSWSRTTSGIRERLELLRNGEPDDLATDHWMEQVEEFMPARISQLFLFDGEKIEAYADFEGTSRLIATAIQNLLGLDVVEQLISDLKTIERRKRPSEIRSADDTELERLAERIEQHASERKSLHQDVASIANEIDRSAREFERVEEEFIRRGGALFVKRNAILQSVEDIRARLAELRARLQDAAAGSAPLLMVKAALDRIRIVDERERDAERAGTVREAVLREHEFLGTLLDGVEPVQRRPLVTAMAERRRLLEETEGPETAWLRLGDPARAHVGLLLDTSLAAEEERLVALRTEILNTRRLLSAAEQELQAIPAEDAIADLVQRRDAAQAAVKDVEERHRALTTELAAVDGRLEALRAQEAALMERTARSRFEQEDVGRMLRHSSRARSTLARFKEQVVLRHVASIETLILESLRQLTGKADLIAGVRIDPATFALELSGRDNLPLSPERLSAGERQILAISILWGLARSCGRALPTVIDTPLGRLDSVHRRHMIERYFPVASHQVLLLSTDQEIVDANLRDLAPHVGRSYRLAHRPGTGSTFVEPGYFEAAA